MYGLTAEIYESSYEPSKKLFYLLTFLYLLSQSSHNRKSLYRSLQKKGPSNALPLSPLQKKKLN